MNSSTIQYNTYKLKYIIHVEVGTNHLQFFDGRPQPSWDRTCTAAAAIGLLSELQLLSEYSSYGLDKQAEAVEDALDNLLESLTARRLRMGRSIQRTERHKRDIC